MSSVCVLGSGECEQLGLGDDAPFEIKRPRLIKSLPSTVKIHQLACGGLHTVLLTTQGKVYTWGCNDEGALGRTGAENAPALVADSLKYPMTNITAGDSHSIAYNTKFNIVYRWGLYRNSLSGKIGEKQEVPMRIAEKVLKDLTLKKIVSGANHTLVLASNRVFGWGDPETGKTGRMLKSRRRNSQSLMMEAIGLKRVRDIFCGTDTSFAITDDKNGKQHVYSWGLNNWGQLGIGRRDNVCTPTEIKEFKNIEIKMLCGGAHHSLALTSDGHVYSWGKNEDGQLGVGDTYTEYSKKKQQELMDIDAEERKLNEECNKLIKEANEQGNASEIKKLTSSHKKSVKKFNDLKNKPENEEEILYFTVPQKVESITDIFYVDSGTTFNYAIGKRVNSNKEEMKDTEMNLESQKESVKQDEKVDQIEVKENEDKNMTSTSQNQLNTPDVSMENSQSQAPTPVKVPEDDKKDEVSIEEVKKENINTVEIKAPEPVMPANIEVAKPLTFVAATPMPTEASKPTDTVADLNLSFNVAYSWGIGNSYVLATKEEENKFTPYEISQDMYRKKVDGEFTNLNPLTVA